MGNSPVPHNNEPEERKENTKDPAPPDANELSQRALDNVKSDSRAIAQYLKAMGLGAAAGAAKALSNEAVSSFIKALTHN